MPLSQLHDGIDVPECLVRIPWLITKSDLYDYIPQVFFKTTVGGWPELRFTLLGVTADFAFNFISHPESKFLAVVRSETESSTSEEAFNRTASILRKHLGKPSSPDIPDHQHWRDDHVWVNHSASSHEKSQEAKRYRLEVYYHAGRPRDWVSGKEQTLVQVKRLFKSMPGVKVIEVWASPAQTVFGLDVRSRRSLAWLAHLSCWANVGIQLYFDAYREANGGLNADDPSGVLYRVKVPGPREPEPGGHATTLQIVGIYLVDYLLERGLLDKDEARRLKASFNNHDCQDDT